MKNEAITTMITKNKKKTESEITIALLQKGATLNQINKQLHKTLVELGVRVDNRTALKTMRESVTPEELAAITNYRILREFCEALAHEFKVEDLDVVVKNVRKLFGKGTAPSKVALGDTKAKVVAYFKHADNPTMEGLTSALEAVVNPADALRAARQLFSFGLLLKNSQDLTDVN